MQYTHKSLSWRESAESRLPKSRSPKWGSGYQYGLYNKIFDNTKIHLNIMTCIPSCISCLPSNAWNSMHACKAVTDRDELDFLFWRKIVITRALIPLKGSHFKLLLFTRRHIDQTPCFVKPSQTGPCILAITPFIRNSNLNLKAQHNLCINNN